MEIEYKFCIPPQRLAALQAAVLRGAHAQIRMEARYFDTALLHKPHSGRDNPNPACSYAIAGTDTDTGTVVGRPSCVKRLSKATRTCSSVT